jgi:UDPglucose 6-dehydrogenase
MEVSVVGTGYVGLVTGACLAALGHRVTCVDSDRGKLARLNRGEIPIYEPGLEELVAKVRAEKRLTFTERLDEAVRDTGVVFVCVGTPPKPAPSSKLQAPGSGYLELGAWSLEPDLSQVEAVAQELGATLPGLGYRVIVNKSTVPVGSGDWVSVLIRDSARFVNGRDAVESEPQFDVVSNPEFLREGSAIQDMLHPDRIVVGSNSDRALATMRELYAPITEQLFAPPEARRSVPYVETDLASAEMIKYAANAFLATKISFINEIANICERVGADVGRVAEGIGLDSRIGRRFLDAGIGWGGSCFGKDVAALARTAADYGYEARILQAVRHVNYQQRQWVVQKLQERLKVLKGKTVGLLGLAFKPHTDDIRDAPALHIARRLLDLGVRVRGLDPVAGPNALATLPELILVSDAEALAEEADALVLVTDWPQFRELDFERLRGAMRHATFIDGRNFLDGSRLRELGFDYWSIGR